MMLTLLTKIIPGQIEVKSLYWVRKEKELDRDLTDLFSLIDDELYDSARNVLSDLVDIWTDCAQGSPNWFKEKAFSSFQKAEAILNFMDSEG